MPRANDFDVIVIGSGIGGLAAASLLATVAHKRVLVLERHFKPGGFTHTFHRKQWCFDVGLHYVGEMAEGGQTRQLFDLASGGELEWNKMASPFERFVYPDLTFEVPDDPVLYEQALGDVFPAERAGLRRWFHAVEGAAGWAVRRIAGGMLPRPLAALLEAPGRRTALRTTRQVVDETVRDPRLRALLTSQWGDYGLPPSLSAFATHALIARHYFEGAWYPRGGSGEIPRTFLRQIEAAGGECRTSCEVDQILVERGRAVGVRAITRHGEHGEVEDLSADTVISDVGVATTYGRLLRAPQLVPAPSPVDGTVSSVTLYLGLSRSPAELGFRGENHWFNSSHDPDAAFAARAQLLQGQVGTAYLSFPSLKDPKARAHTAEIIAMVDPRDFAPWRDQPWMKRDDDYRALKARVAGALLDLVERHHPGFRSLVAFQELSTPLTVEHFTGHGAGSIYGAAATPARLRDHRYGTRTPVRGLYLAGADAGSLGIVGAFMGGAFAAALSLGLAGMPRIFGAAAKRAAQHGPQQPKLLGAAPHASSPGNSSAT